MIENTEKTPFMFMHIMYRSNVLVHSEPVSPPRCHSTSKLPTVLMKVKVQRAKEDEVFLCPQFNIRNLGPIVYISTSIVTYNFCNFAGRNILIRHVKLWHNGNASSFFGVGGGAKTLTSQNVEISVSSYIYCIIARPINL